MKDYTCNVRTAVGKRRIIAASHQRCAESSQQFTDEFLRCSRVFHSLHWRNNRAHQSSSQHLQQQQQQQTIGKKVSDWLRFNITLDTLQVISETVLQAITCTGTDNEN